LEKSSQPSKKSLQVQQHFLFLHVHSLQVSDPSFFTWGLVKKQNWCAQPTISNITYRQQQ
jgi:hypothetical protein